jgi:putative ABC transport system permease protein
MLRNYVKIALRNIIRHKSYSFINIAGLAIGMACCFLIILWVQDELSFDQFHEKKNELYRVVGDLQIGDQISHSARTPNPLGPALVKEYPEIVNFTRFQGFDHWHVQAGEKNFLNDLLAVADPSFFEIFTFPFLKGNPKTALLGPLSIVITEDMANKYFGDEESIGKVIKIHNKEFHVTGLIKNIPPNSHIQFDAMFPIINMEDFWHDNFDNWERVMYYTYIQLQKNTSGEDVSKKISGVVKKYNPKLNSKIYLQPLKDIHLRSNYQMDLDNYQKSSITYVYIFSLIALWILMIACINFVNLATAQSSKRAKEVGMRKVIGADKTDIIKQFLGESILLSFIALIFALALVELFLPAFNTLSGKDIKLDFSNNIFIILGVIGLALITGILSGSYPSLFLSSFKPVDILRGISKIGKNHGAYIRKILIIAQFCFTIMLIIATTVIYSQLRYIRNRDLGFDKENLIYFPSHGAFHNPDNYEVIKYELLQNPNVLNITMSYPPALGSDATTDINWEGKNPHEEIIMRIIDVDCDYLETFKMKMNQGRFFSKDYSTEASNYIINQAAAVAMGDESPVGKRLWIRSNEGTIIGVIKNFHHRSLHNEIAPVILKIREEEAPICVRINSENIPETISFLKSKWNKYVGSYISGYPFPYRFLDETIANFYKSEQKIGTVVKYFTCLAIFVSCLGLFGLASFMSQQRTKEIGIRKILGATISDILLLLTKEFAKWVLIANIIAWPIAYFVMNRLLQVYAYRINIGIWIFIAAAISALFITLITVSYHAIRAAFSNPIEALRYE